jgi:hypothetical protein
MDDRVMTLCEARQLGAMTSISNNPAHATQATGASRISRNLMPRTEKLATDVAPKASASSSNKDSQDSRSPYISGRNLQPLLQAKDTYPFLEFECLASP